MEDRDSIPRGFLTDFVNTISKDTFNEVIKIITRSFNIFIKILYI